MNAKFSNPLNNVKIASPCSQDWNAMIGNERRRYCGDCKLNVYNLSGMSKTEAENLLINSEGRLCVRFYRRADGSVLTKDCPVGWQAVKARLSKTATAFASMIFALLSGVGLANYFVKNGNQITGTMTPNNVNATMGAIAIDDNSNSAIQGKPIAVMGNVAIEPQKRGFEQGEIGKMLIVPQKNKKSAR